MEIDKAPSHTTSHQELSVEFVQDEPFPGTAEAESPQPRKKRGRPPKVREADDGQNQETPTTDRLRMRQSIALQPTDDYIEIIEAPSKAPKALVIPKRKPPSTKTKRTTSAAVYELADTEDAENDISSRTRSSGRSVAAPIEVPEPNQDSEQEEVVPAPRGKKARRTRGRSITVRNSAVTNDTPKPAGRRSRTAPKRDISAVYNDTIEMPSPPAKRKASGLRSIQKIPTPSDDSRSEIFEDSKSTFSDVDDAPKPARGGRRPSKSQSKVLASEDREAEDAQSPLYHSADDDQSSPKQSRIVGKNKREMVDNAKRELEEEIWRERVANGEAGVGGSSEDDEKENAIEEKGKKPTRTVRGKGSKGRKAKAKAKKGSKVAEVSEDDAHYCRQHSHC